MTSKSCSRRNRVIQRRYKRRGRRSPNNLREPPDPGGRKKKPLARTYNFNTFPHHGATPASYLQYIKSILVPKFITRREHYLSLRNSLSIDRHTHYKPMGYRCPLIPLPPTPNDQTNDPEPNANLNDSFLWDNLLHNDIPTFPSTLLTIEPTHIDSITPPIHLLPVTFLPTLPLYHYLTLTFVVLLSKILQRKILFGRNWPRHQSHSINSPVQHPSTTNFMEPSFLMSTTSTTRHPYSSLYDTTLPNSTYDSDTIYHNPWLTTAPNSPVHDQFYLSPNSTHYHPTLSTLHQLTPMSFVTQELMTSSLSSYRRFSSTLSHDHFLHTSSPNQPAPSALNHQSDHSL